LLKRRVVMLFRNRGGVAVRINRVAALFQRRILMGKEAFDFFPLDVHLSDKMELIEAEFGLIGFAVIVKLWMRIYGSRGYYCEFDEEVALMFSHKTGVGVNAVSEILNAAFKRGIFDKTLYEKYKILTSKGIQERCMKMCSRRKRFEVEKKYLLISVPDSFENVYIKGENVNISEENVYIFTQSKVKERKESKVNKSKVNEVPEAEEHKDLKHKYGKYNNVLLTDEEIKQLREKLPKDWEKWIEKFSEGLELKGYKYNNHYLAILQWEERSGQKNDDMRNSKFNNYTDTNKTNYTDTNKTNYASIEKKILADMYGNS
jgi:hypothetical protein